MARVNLTLDDDTKAWLERHAKPDRRAALARTLIREGIARREAIARRKKLAADYAAGRADARAILNDFDMGSLEIIGDEEAFPRSNTPRSALAGPTWSISARLGRRSMSRASRTRPW